MIFGIYDDDVILNLDWLNNTKDSRCNRFSAVLLLKLIII